MNNVAQLPLPPQDTVRESYRRMYAKGLSDDEFALYMDLCTQKELHPSMVIPYVKSAVAPEDRGAPIFYIKADGMKSLAQRCGDYLGMTEEPTVAINPDLVNENTNPKGYEKIVVRIMKLGKDSKYHPVIGVALWDERVPLTEWHFNPAANPAEGQWSKGAPHIDKVRNSGWLRMPYTMLVKCAEMDALRRGWPDQFAGLFGEEEVDRIRASDPGGNGLATLMEKQVVEPTPEPVEPVVVVEATVEPVIEEPAPVAPVKVYGGPPVWADFLEGPVQMPLDQAFEEAERFVNTELPQEVIRFKSVNKYFSEWFRHDKGRTIRLRKRVDEIEELNG